MLYRISLPYFLLTGKNVRGSGHKDSAHSNWNSSMNKGNAGGGLGGGGGSGLGGGINRANGKYVVCAWQNWFQIVIIVSLLMFFGHF